MTPVPLLLIGASGLAVEVAECARRLGREVLGCLDDNPDLVGEQLAGGLAVLGTTDALAAFVARPDSESCAIVVCVGHGAVRRRMVGRLVERGVSAKQFATVIDDQSVLPPGSTIGPGSVVLAGVVVTAPVTIGAHVVLMPHVTVTHDNVIEDFVTLAAGVSLGGAVRVSTAAYVGMNASVHPRVTVGAGATLGMGAALVRDLPAGETWVGVPARPIASSAVAPQRRP